jgi:hypothetical protein
MSAVTPMEDKMLHRRDCPLSANSKISLGWFEMKEATN